MATKPLTHRRQAFVREYLIDLNATQAAIRAGYSVQTAHAEAASWVTGKTRTAIAISRAMAARAVRTEFKQDDVLRELGAVALCDPAEAYDDNGNLLPIREMPAHVRRAISSIKTRVEHARNDGEDDATIVEVKFWDKTRTLELIGKHLEMFKERHEHSLGQIPAGMSLTDLAKWATDDAEEK